MKRIVSTGYGRTQLRLRAQRKKGRQDQPG
jgi:hypothetical protein